MAWSTVYIRGREDFQKAIISRLERKWMQGSPEVMGDLLMFWLPDDVALRNLKIAIGSKLILKYRLNFITNLNNHLNPLKNGSAEFTILEREMIDKMTQMDNTQDPIAKTGT